MGVPSTKSRINARFCFLEQLQLLSRCIDILHFFSIKKFYIPKLFVCNTHDSDMPKFWKKRFNSFYMYYSILATSTMTYINKKLKHCKTILLQILSEIRISLLFFLRFSRQIKKNKHPHNSIFTKAIHSLSFRISNSPKLSIKTFIK